jgi:pyruvate dehydrogenase E1 component alpha subunit
LANIGEEAVETSAIGELEPGDVITSTHRGQGHNVALGGRIQAMMAELLCRNDGYSHGRRGSMHIADRGHGNVGANGIVAGGIPIAVGSPLGFHMQRLAHVVLAFLGDAALNEGGFHEAADLATIWSLPVAFIVENNQYGMSGSIHDMFHLHHLADRAQAYGIPDLITDGTDVFQVPETIRAAVDRARQEQGPSLIETITYRYKGHSKLDSNRYRTREEMQQWRQRDPILHVRQFLLSKGVSEEELNFIVASVRAEVQDALHFAESSPWPDPGQFESEVYAGGANNG